MEQAIVLNTDDIKQILADYFNVSENSVVSAKDSYIVIGAKTNN